MAPKKMRPAPSLYTLNAFPASFAISAPSTTLPTVNDICRSMLVVGYPSKKSALTIGGPWRALLLENMVQGYVGAGLVPTSYFDNLEQSERGAMSFLLAQAFTHLAATKSLGARYLVHVNGLRGLTYKPGSKIALLAATKPPGSSKSRPDFIGRTKSRGYIVFETKGRTGAITAALTNKALKQAAKIATINGAAPVACVASCFSFPRGKQIRGVLTDPRPNGTLFDLTFSDAAAACKAYSFFLDSQVSPALRRARGGFMVIDLPGGGRFGIDSDVLEALNKMKQDRHDSDELLLGVLDRKDELLEDRVSSGYDVGADGILVDLSGKREFPRTRERSQRRDKKDARD